MATELKTIHDKLKNIKTNLVKSNYSRRTKVFLQQKLSEATQLRSQFDDCMLILSQQIERKQLKSQVLVEIQAYCDSIRHIYIDIEDICSKEYCPPSHKIVEGVERKSIDMASFDFKVATSLLPVMTGEENVTKNLIDAIELYSSTLNEQGIDMLIKFVLKTRLNQSAKLRLSSTYETCDALLVDMRLHLLSKKSSTSIHKEMLQVKQNGMSLDNYGRKIEELFVDLTISQADGDQNAYTVLRPLNEKIAVRSFNDGLRNQQLRTILSARNYTSLKDTIRAAKDEEASSSRQNPEPSVYFGNRGKFSNNRYFRNNNRGRFGQSNQQWSRGSLQTNYANRQPRGQISGTYPQRGGGYPRRGQSGFHGVSNTGKSESFLCALESLRVVASLLSLRNTLRKALRNASDAGLPPASGADDVGVGNSVSVGVPLAVPAVPPHLAADEPSARRRGRAAAYYRPHCRPGQTYRILVAEPCLLLFRRHCSNSPLDLRARGQR
ncbi:hypothetical protein SFRURICE_004748 [Spodoptera frugiperda]|nr:hypothetical protein SFRURICE_004748 [Spodoptera frugiperda]